MIDFLCKIWPYLAGGLLGWLAAGWFARRLKYAEPAVEKIVEKQVDRVVDNPQHLALISKLERENKEVASLKTQLSGYESSSAKTVDNPAHLKRISELESQLSEQQRGPKIDLAAARAAGIEIKDESDFTAVEGIGPKISDLIKADGVKTFNQLSNTPVSSIQTVLDNAGPSYKIANPGTWPDQANLAANNRWPALKALQDVLIGGVYPDASSKQSSDGSAAKVANKAKSSATGATPAASVSTLDKAAAKTAGFRVRSKNGQDDFTVVEGIGPKIDELIHGAGIHTYAELARTKVETIQKILDDAGPRYTLAKPGTWPAQSEMASENKWEALKVWQDELDGGE